MLVEALLTDMRDRLLAGSLGDFSVVYDPVYTIDGSAFGSSFIEDAWNTLQGYGKDGIAVEAAFAPAVYRNAHCIISVVSANTEPDTVFHNAGDMRLMGSTPSYGVEYGGPVTDIIDVYIMAPNRPILRVLDLLIKSTIMDAGKWFTDNGASGGPEWLRTSDLTPVTTMVGTETVVKYVRKQSWRVYSSLVVRPFGGRSASYKHILVHATGTYVSSVVDPDTRTSTPLNGTSEGQVVPALDGGDE